MLMILFLHGATAPGPEQHPTSGNRPNSHSGIRCIFGDKGGPNPPWCWSSHVKKSGDSTCPVGTGAGGRALIHSSEMEELPALFPDLEVQQGLAPAIEVEKGLSQHLSQWNHHPQPPSSSSYWLEPQGWFPLLYHCSLCNFCVLFTFV